MDRLSVRELARKLDLSTAYLHRAGLHEMSSAEQVDWLRDYADDQTKAAQIKHDRAKRALVVLSELGAS